MINFKNKKILITGATGGIGNALVKKFVTLEGNVMATGTKTEKLDTLKKNFPNINILKFDISDHSKIEEFIENVSSQLTGLDILVNNAGINMDNLSLRMKEEEWNKVIDLNLNAVFYCCKAVVPFMLKNNYGRIVNIASIAGKEGNPNASAYSTSKAGVIGLTKSLGKELALKNIAVNCVTPAAAKTRIFDQMTEKHIDYMLSKIPRNRFAKVEELASLVAWLVSEENSFSTGAVFDLSGGRATY